MFIADMHCDLPEVIAAGKKLSCNRCHWSEDKLSRKHTYIQTFAVCVDKLLWDNPFDRADFVIKSFLSELSKSDISLVTSPEELLQSITLKRNSALLAIEGGEALGGRLENTELFYNMGVRLINLTWNRPNQLGTPSGSALKGASLTDFGRAVVGEMNRLGMIVDVSHLCEEGFWDVARISRAPFCAGHSNSKRLCNHHRNLSDGQFCEIARCGGVVGINFFPDFLEKNPLKADITSIVRHIEHFLGLGGENAVCLGSDFDGIDRLPRGIDGIGSVLKIAEELSELNYSNELIYKIMGKNAVDFLLRVL